ncbi:MAG: EAL domain-containing protein [Gammaproteobacteria bacterium]|nr:EAL domain-containing protein [Gammaproteobacteria bacterium]
MISKYLTLQKTLAITILLIGVLGIALVVATDFTYRKVAYRQQIDSINQLIAVKSADLIKKLSERHRELGIRLQNEADFIKAFTARDIKGISTWLDQEFNRYYVTIGLIKLEKVLIFDQDFRMIANSDRGIEIANRNTRPCSRIISQISQLPGIERTRPISQLCEYNSRPLMTTVISIGSIKPKGYIQIITDPAHILTQIETELALPLKIFNRNEELLHQSINWPIKNDIEKHLVSRYMLRDGNGRTGLIISSASDITTLISQLDDTRYKVILGATALTLVTLLIAFLILHRGLLPLKHLRRAADCSARGEFTSVSETGYNEISKPIHAFNIMVEKIQSLIGDLTNEVDDHKKTEDKYRQAKEVAELHAQHANQQSNFLHMTLQSIVDGVITTSIEGHINSINPMAEQLTGWSENEAIGKPLFQVMHALDENTQKRIYDPIANIEHKSVLDEPVGATLIQNNSNIETPVEYVAAPMRDHEDKIAGIVVIIHDESVQRSLNRQLTFQATHDALTGLINRYEFERRLKNVITAQTVHESVNTLCYIDLDQFKLVNDTCGHTAGDDLLKKITLLLQDTLGNVGTLARLGGDEFGLLLENTDTRKAQSVALGVLDVIKNFHFTWNENTFTIGASIGIASIPNNALNCEEILSNADSACYLAKESGRNRIQVYTEEDDKLLTQQREMHWVSRINHALEEGRFQLYFQEIISLRGHEQAFIMHGEVLLRMIDKEGNIVSPNQFLPAAERYNMATLIDEWVVDRSIQWLASRKEKVLISINLSGMSISNRDFLNFVVSRIKQNKVNPELLCFEITETAAINNLGTAIHFMNVLKKLGCSFALDDFGSGLSSFSYLNSLPVDYLKIDGTFVMDIDKDPMHYAMVKSINEVGQVMGIKTIAEFAASKDIIDCLREVGVDNAQGYAVARPVALASLSIEDKTPTLTAVKADKSAS